MEILKRINFFPKFFFNLFFFLEKKFNVNSGVWKNALTVHSLIDLKPIDISFRAISGSEVIDFNDFFLTEFSIHKKIALTFDLCFSFSLDFSSFSLVFFFQFQYDKDERGEVSRTKLMSVVYVPLTDLNGTRWLQNCCTIVWIESSFLVFMCCFELILFILWAISYKDKQISHKSI